MLTIEQVSQKYEISTRTVRRYLASGRLRGYRIGPRMIRLDAAEVAEDLLGSQVGGRA
ncbi:helix-turn-helix domain-containing protein [Gordonia hirsuta]|nr:helix-turn-helix domain-containing protein [Gordonia hirsuta]